jgi:hypothetical protein
MPRSSTVTIRAFKFKLFSTRLGSSIAGSRKARGMTQGLTGRMTRKETRKADDGARGHVVRFRVAVLQRGPPAHHANAAAVTRKHTGVERRLGDAQGKQGGEVGRARKRAMRCLRTR